VLADALSVFNIGKEAQEFSKRVEESYIPSPPINNVTDKTYDNVHEKKSMAMFIASKRPPIHGLFAL